VCWNIIRESLEVSEIHPEIMEIRLIKDGKLVVTFEEAK